MVFVMMAPLRCFVLTGLRPLVRQRFNPGFMFGQLVTALRAVLAKERRELEEVRAVNLPVAVQVPAGVIWCVRRDAAEHRREGKKVRTVRRLVVVEVHRPSVWWPFVVSNVIGRTRLRWISTHERFRGESIGRAYGDAIREAVAI